MAATFVELTMRGTVTRSSGGDEIVSNVFHYVCLPGASTLSPANVAAAFNAKMGGSVPAVLSDTYISIETLYRNLMSPLNPVIITAVIADGVVTGDRLPLMSSAVIRLKCADRGKRFRGSKHLAPLAESQTLLDELTAGVLVTMGTVGTAFSTTFTDSDGNVWNPIVLSRTYSNLTALTPTFVFSLVNGFIVNKTVGTMRRRKEKTSI